MNKTLQIVKAGCVFLLLLVPLQAADGLSIKSGSFTYEQHVGRIILIGTSGLRLEASVSFSGGVMGPDNQCGLPECEIGTTMVSLNAFWSGGDLPGTLRLRGKEYALASPNVNPTSANGLVEFSGSVEVPEVVGDETIQVSAPFTMTGFVDYGQGADGFAIHETMQGGGTATLTFAPNFNQTAWRFLSADYVFD
jgi:hypothetical protein